MSTLFRYGLLLEGESPPDPDYNDGVSSGGIVFGGTVSEDAEAIGSKQLIQCGVNFNPGTSGVSYSNALWKSGSWVGSQSYQASMIPTEGALSKLRICLDAAPGAGKSYTFTIIKNGSPTDLSVTISDSATTGSDELHSLSLSTNDYLIISCTPSGTPTSVRVHWTLIFEPTVDGECIFGGHSGDSFVFNDYYMPIGGSATTANEWEAQTVIPVAGTISKLLLKMQTAPGAQHYYLTARKNGFAQTLVADIVGATTINQDTANSFAVSAGDLLSFLLTYSGAGYSRHAFAFVVAPNSKSTSFSTFSSSPSDSLTQYAQPYIGVTSYTTENAFINRSPVDADFKVAGLYVVLDAAPGSGKSRAFYLQKGGFDTELSFTISDEEVSAGDAGDIQVANFELLSLKTVPASTPATTWAYGAVVYEAVASIAIDPAASGGIVFGGTVSEDQTIIESISSGGVVFGSAGDLSTPENNQIDGVAAGGIVFGGYSTEQWSTEPNNSVAVKGGLYRISGVVYTLANTMAIEGLGSIAALVNCSAAPVTAGTYRYDLLSIDAAGDITVTAGTQATVPVMPTTPAGSIKLNHVLRYYGQTSIVQSDIGKIWLAPALATIEAAIADDELAWAEMSTTITITCRDQYGQLFTGSKTVNAAFESGNGTIAPLLRSGGGSSFVFTYTRGGNDPGDISPMLTFSSPTGALCVAFIKLLDAGGAIMI